ncbi:Sortase family protein [Nakamurella panacisegetis]|uniref:Sortase family protein n=1 Tax=Nakamurella panacisegetis TaxID=1090615 RepID=A0A1H0L3C7_9ACTN|nr:Sortase family protein [Nakamurella panacisegetis]
MPPPISGRSPEPGGLPAIGARRSPSAATHGRSARDAPPPGTTGPSAKAAPSADRDAGSAPAPVLLQLPTLRVTAPVQPVDVVGGELQVPDDPRTVGWWRASAPPGSPVGSTVVDGHIDSATAGLGALFHLADLDPGDEVSVRTSAGRVVPYTVRARRVYVKSAGLPAEIFTRSGPPRLVLISCGGPFDAAAHSYQDNIIVFATPST